MSRMTYAEYLRRDWGEPVELIRGVPIVRPALDAVAQTVRDNLFFSTGRWRWHNAENYDRRSEPPVVTGPDSVTHPPFALYAARDGESSTPPLLTVEFVRPGEQWKDVYRRATEQLRAGVQEVWIINPRRPNVKVFRPDDEPHVLHIDAELTSDALPGFRCTVGEIFAGL